MQFRPKYSLNFRNRLKTIPPLDTWGKGVGPESARGIRQAVERWGLDPRHLRGWGQGSIGNGDWNSFAR